jgi:hypothetical protein
VMQQQLQVLRAAQDSIKEKEGGDEN